VSGSDYRHSEEIDVYDGIGNPVEIWSNWRTLKAEKTELFGPGILLQLQAVGPGADNDIHQSLMLSFIDAINRGRHTGCLR